MAQSGQECTKMPGPQATLRAGASLAAIFHTSLALWCDFWSTSLQHQRYLFLIRCAAHTVPVAV
jgi:hypothetical protein